MHESDRHAALANGRRDPLHRTEPNITTGEDAGYARLEQVRIAVEFPAASSPKVGAVPGFQITIVALGGVLAGWGSHGLLTADDQPNARQAPRKARDGQTRLRRHTPTRITMRIWLYH